HQRFHLEEQPQLQRVSERRFLCTQLLLKAGDPGGWNALLEAKIDTDGRVPAEGDGVGEGERIRLSSKELVAAGGELGGERGMANQKAIHPDARPGGSALNGQAGFPRPGQLPPEVLETPRERGGERLRAPT